ncbi:MAG: hypothetical protein V1729_00830 [Candidatus Woesearchaeota archaeon]
MKKPMLIVILIIALFAVGCTPQISCDAPSEVLGNECCLDNDGDGVCDSEEVAKEPEIVLEPEPEPEVEIEPEPQSQGQDAEDVQEKVYQEYLAKLSASDRRMSKIVRTLVQKAMVTEENYFYRYSGPKRQQIEFWVKGDEMKVQILEPIQLDMSNLYNMVYLDRKSGKAEGYCETAGKSTCWKGHGPFSETVEANIKMTPKDWLLKLGDRPYFASQNTIDGVLYYIVDYPTDDGIYRVTLGNWKGWPREVALYKTNKPSQTVKADDSWLYEHMELGVVGDKELTPNSALATKPKK